MNGLKESSVAEPRVPTFDEVRRQWPSFKAIPMPNVVGLFCGNGVGSKLLQGYVDGAPDLYMVPAYPLMYLYPHWQDWQKKYRHDWNWSRVIDLLCEKHASVIDSRRIPGFNGLQNLGANRDEYVAVDEELFRRILAHLLEGEPVRSSTLVLAVHYAYALCLGDDISKKRVLIYHVHAFEYIHYFLNDFPDAQVVAMTRDPRSNLGRRVAANYKVDEGKLNRSDTYFYRALAPYHVIRYILQDMQVLASAARPEMIRVIRHEDLGIRLEEVLKKLCAWIGLTYTPEMLKVTFGGKEWWGDDVYNMPPTNKFFSRVLSKDWQKSKGFVEWFVQEGLTVDFFRRYGYTADKYTRDSLFNRFLLVLLMLLPTRTELRLIGFYLNPLNLARVIGASIDEAYARLPIKDYTWNATYLYKWEYIELRLWEARPHVRLLMNMRAYAGRSKSKILRSLLTFTAAVIYVAGQLVRYAYAYARLPYWFLRTRKVMVLRLREMWTGSAKLPDPLLSAPLELAN